ncbi:MAG: DUF4445 domain-containing protein [Firmicutes bacterium]|nr:DUF4445 domain-containing protein [Bacillota bacterium]
MLTVLREEGNLQVEMREGESIAAALRRAGLLAEECEAGGLCGRCRVRLAPADACEPVAEEYAVLSLAELRSGWRLACCHTQDELFVQLPSLPLQRRNEPLLRNDLPCGLALDIGLDIIEAALVELRCGKVLARTACSNSQRRLAPDLRRREAYAEARLPVLRAALAQDIRYLAASLCQAAAIDPLMVSRISCAADPLSAAVLGGGASSGMVSLRGMELGIGAREAYLLPVAGQGIGGSAVAALSAGLPQQERERVLLIGLRSNCELLLADRDRLSGCAVYGGAVLESVGLSCGIPPLSGAAYRLWPWGDAFLPETVGDAPPRGLSFNGAVSALAQLLAQGRISSEGRLAGGKLYLDQEQRLWLNQEDVRALQLAQCALRCALDMLLQKADLWPQDIDRVLLYGALPRGCSGEELCAAGFLPEVLADKLYCLGNAPLQIAVAALLQEDVRRRAEKLAARVNVFDPLAEVGWEDGFAAALCFPKS